MTSHALPRSYSIKEAAALTGLPASTLRYYEQIGVIAPISRGASSGHRVYDDGDLDQLMWVSCLAATGMSVGDMRLYMANNRLGAEAAADQRAAARGAAASASRPRPRALVLRQRYVALKIAYWQAVQAGDDGAQRAGLRPGARRSPTSSARSRTTRSTDRPPPVSTPRQNGRPFPMRVNAYAAPSAGEPLAPTTIERREVGAHDVLIAIEYAGICHSDIHTVNGDWGPQPFPVVPGHEIVGTVTEVGADVTSHRVGDRVGVGCMVNSCGECDNCRNGDEQYCVKGMVGTYAVTDRRRHDHPGRLLHARRRGRRLRALRPGGPRPGGRRAAAVRRHHDVLAAAALEGRPGHEGRRRRPRRPRPHGRQDRPRDGRRGHGALAVAEEAGGRPAARGRPLLRDLRTPTRSRPWPVASTSSSTP